jgi:hypothetical protein
MSYLNILYKDHPCHICGSTNKWATYTIIQYGDSPAIVLCSHNCEAQYYRRKNSAKIKELFYEYDRE